MAPTLLLLLLLLSLSARTAAAAHGYKWAAGALPAGDDAVPPLANITLAAAEAKCSSLAECGGFTFQSKAKSPEGEIPKVYLKSSFTPGATKNAAWQSYLRDDYKPNPMTKGKQIPGPANASDRATLRAWHTDMIGWRAAYRNSTKYTGAVYDDPQLTWTQTSYMQPQMRECDGVA
eukprot:SAG31_NODE_1371_length_8605_cov_20.357630_6_plen_176_part_00